MATDLETINVLVVSDVPSLTKQLVSIIETLTDGFIIKAGHRNNPFEMFCNFRTDLVVADADMVSMDAMDLTRNIRHDPASRDRKAPVILITAQTMAAWIESARDAGVTALVIKPFSSNDLVKRIKLVVTDPRVFIDGGAYVARTAGERYSPRIRDPSGGNQIRKNQYDAVLRPDTAPTFAPSCK